MSNATHDNRPIYLDYAATTPVAPEVAAAMSACLTADGLFANPASDHRLGRLARAAVSKATDALADLLGCAPEELTFTSGATESNNLAIKGAFEFYGQRIQKPHFITSNIEHKAVLDVAGCLEQQGVSVTRLEPDANGVVSAQQVEAALTDDTVLVSIQHVNNELGSIQPIAEIAALLAGHAARLHVDAAQSVGKIPLDLSSLAVDYLSLSAHKFYGPKGAGALYVRSQPRARLRAQMHGGLQQQGLRSGTLPVHQIVGLGKAAELAKTDFAGEAERLLALRARLESALAKIDGVVFNAGSAERVPGICNVSFEGVGGDSLLAEISHLMLSSGSACTSDTGEPSYVLRALGHSDRLAEASLRISLGKFTSETDVEMAVDAIVTALTRLRECSPWWGDPRQFGTQKSQATSAAWGDEAQLWQQGDALVWKAAGRRELLALMPLALKYYQQHGSTVGLIQALETSLEIPTDRRYLLLLVEDLFRGLGAE